VSTELCCAEKHSVLVVDDEPGMRTALQANFLRNGWSVHTAAGVLEGKRALEHGTFDLVLSDIRMRDGDGFELLHYARESAPEVAVILLTAYGSVPEAVTSMRGGAFDYLMKPVSFDQLQAAAQKVMQRRVVRGATAKQHQVSQSEPLSGGIVGRSPQLLQALQRARTAATTDADILVEAESGTGKELVARLIHASSDRRERPFVAVNCAAIPEDLIESELFGHAKGAFTGAGTAKAGKFELADGGTLLLDEIGEMPLSLQPKLLRALQEREFERVGGVQPIHVDIRVIATTNASLGALVEQGLFRSDLYYRLNVIPLSLPPLRQRTGDVRLLAEHFVKTHAREAGSAAPVLAASFLEQLERHDWPGNVRELSNFMRRVLSLNPDAVMDAACFHREFQPLLKVQPKPAFTPAAGMRIAAMEKLHLESTLELTHGNRTHAAQLLGISLRTVRNKIKEYGLPPRRYA